MSRSPYTQQQDDYTPDASSSHASSSSTANKYPRSPPLIGHRQQPRARSRQSKVLHKVKQSVFVVLWGLIALFGIVTFWIGSWNLVEDYILGGAAWAEVFCMFLGLVMIMAASTDLGAALVATNAPSLASSSASAATANTEAIVPPHHTTASASAAAIPSPPLKPTLLPPAAPATTSPHSPLTSPTLSPASPASSSSASSSSSSSSSSAIVLTAIDIGGSSNSTASSGAAADDDHYPYHTGARGTSTIGSDPSLDLDGQVDAAADEFGTDTDAEAAPRSGVDVVKLYVRALSSLLGTVMVWKGLWNLMDLYTLDKTLGRDISYTVLGLLALIVTNTLFTNAGIFTRYSSAPACCVPHGAQIGIAIGDDDDGDGTAADGGAGGAGGAGGGSVVVQRDMYAMANVLELIGSRGGFSRVRRQRQLQLIQIHYNRTHTSTQHARHAQQHAHHSQTHAHLHQQHPSASTPA